jgi:predicted CXXCH cytochrome family protein
MSTSARQKLLAATAVVAAGMLLGLPSDLPGHVDSPLLLEGCGSCHVGHGMSGQPMLARAEEEFCYQCHGSLEERSRMIESGRLSPAAARLGDVEAQFQKAYRHPVVEGVGHSPTEELPMMGAGSVQHAECSDCHNPHDRTRTGSTAVKKVKGYSLTGQRLETSTREFEICLKCHSDRLSIDKSERSLIDDFSIDARSQHPVTRAGSGAHLPSTQTTAGVGGIMSCSDCHNSGDLDGPRGPHGSDHRFLLSGNYDVEVYTDESAFAFEFCYSCHNRSSILNDESFPLHREHVVGDPIAGRSGTSCYTCHVSHGSPVNPHMLEFNPRAVQPEELTGLTEYRSLGSGTGECYLKCHGYNHGPGRY